MVAISQRSNFLLFQCSFITASLEHAEAGHGGTYSVGEGVKIDVLEKTPSACQTPLAVHSKSCGELLKPAVQQPSY